MGELQESGESKEKERTMMKNGRRGELREWDNKVKERGGRKIESAETESKHNGNGRVRTSRKLEEMSGECETQMKVEVKRKIE